MMRSWSRCSSGPTVDRGRCGIGVGVRAGLPGATAGASPWLYSADPDRYEPLSGDELIELCYPVQRDGNRRRLKAKALKAVEDL